MIFNLIENKSIDPDIVDQAADHSAFRKSAREVSPLKPGFFFFEDYEEFKRKQQRNIQQSSQVRNGLAWSTPKTIETVTLKQITPMNFYTFNEFL